MRLLLLEDDDAVGDGLRAFLQSEGHVVEWCTSIGHARLLIDEPFDVLLLDWNLPDGSGVDWLQSLRTRGLTVPAIVLTARDLVRDRIRGLDSGADDFLVKPFEAEELSARLRSLGRRMAGNNQRKAFGDVEIDLAARAVWSAGQPQDVTAREWAVLEALVLRQGRIVTKADLEAIVFGSASELASNAIEVHIFNLRRKLGKAAIETVRGLGYRIG